MRFLIALALLGLAAGVTGAFVAFGGALLGTGAIVVPLAAGVGAGVLADRLILRRAPVIETFGHELTHAVCAIVFLRRIESFVVRWDGNGAVRHRGRFGGVAGDDFIGLAPYFMPILTVTAVLVRPLLDRHWFPGFDIGIGGVFGHHLSAATRQMRGGWTGRVFQSTLSGRPVRSDIAERGFAYSFLFITVSGLAVAGFLAAVLLEGYPGIGAWAGKVWETTWRLGGTVVGTIRP
jgi:hypothetical protein